MLTGKRCKLCANLYALSAPAVKVKLINVLTTVLTCSPNTPNILGNAKVNAFLTSFS